MVEDRLLEALQRGTRIDPKFLGQLCAGGLIAGEGIRLALGPIEGEHVLRAESLSEGVFLDERRELRRDLTVTPTREVGIDPLLQRRETELVQPPRSKEDERFV